MKYENIKKAHISREEIAKAFGFKNRHSFNSTSANKRYMKGVDAILELAQLKELELAFKSNADIVRKAYGIPKKLMNENVTPVALNITPEALEKAQRKLYTELKEAYGEPPLIETLKNNKI